MGLCRDPRISTILFQYDLVYVMYIAVFTAVSLQVLESSRIFFILLYVPNAATRTSCCEGDPDRLQFVAEKLQSDVGRCSVGSGFT